MHSVRYLACVVTTALLTCSGAATSIAASAESTALKGHSGADNGLIAIGSDPIPFQLQDLDGDTVSLSDFKGKKAVLLAFWSFFCGPCREEIPLLDEITKKHAPQDLEMLAINLDGPKLEKAVQKYVSAGNFSFRVVWEEIEGVQYKTADAYGVAGTPSVVLIDKRGKVSWTHVGREEGPTIEKEIQKALK